MTTKVRDLRAGFYWLNNEIFDTYLKKIGVIPYAVYSALTRFANNDTAKCNPSRSTIAEYLGISTKSVDRAIKILTVCSLIRVNKARREDHGYDHNVYTLLGVGTNSPQVGDNQGAGVASISPTNNTKTFNQTNCDAVEWLADTYRKMFNRPLWTLTKLRKDKALARLAECLKKTKGEMKPAVKMMLAAMNGLRASKFHNGENDRSKKYIEWEKHLYNSPEKLEQWLMDAVISPKKPGLMGGDGLEEMRARRAAKRGA